MQKVLNPYNEDNLLIIDEQEKDILNHHSLNSVISEDGITFGYLTEGLILIKMSYKYLKYGLRAHSFYIKKENH